MQQVWSWGFDAAEAGGRRQVSKGVRVEKRVRACVR